MMNNGKTHFIPIGSLIQDTQQGDIGIVVGPLVEKILPKLAAYHYSPPRVVRTQLVLWPANNGAPYEMDLGVLDEGWVEVISESR